MPSNMDELFDLEPREERDLLEREERCRKTMKAVTKAIIMRLAVCGILLWVMFRTRLELWTMGLLVLVLLINLSGVLPLYAQLKKSRAQWKRLLEEEE